MKILLLGSFHGKNKGDEAIALGEILALRKQWPDAEVTIASMQPEYFESVYSEHQVKGVKISKVLSIIKLLRSSDLCVIGGGGLFFEPKRDHVWNFKKNQSLVWPIFSTLAAIFRTPVIFFGIGSEPLYTQPGKLIVRFGLNRAKTIIVRDQKTKDLLSGLRVQTEIILSRDSAWLLAAHVKQQARKQATADLRIGISPHFGVAVLESKEFVLGYHKIFAEQLTAFQKKVEKKIEWVFYPMHTSDVEACKNIIRQMSTANSSLIDTKSKTPLSVIEDFNNLDMHVGMRMHGSILSAIAGTPFVSITYANKSEMAVQQIFNGSSIDWKSVAVRYDNLSKLKSKLQFVYANLDKINEIERASVASISADVKLNLPTILSTLGITRRGTKK